MMTFFPIPYEDELLYSILARYRIHSGNISLKSTLEDIYGNRNITAAMDLPSHIDKIIANLPICSKYSSEELIERYTLYPLYSAFLPPEDAEIIKKYMKEDKGGSIYNKIGLMASSISLNQYFKFCPQCLEEDMRNYGELYWHRLHQIPGILVCSKHKVLLHNSQVPVRGFNRHEYINASLDVCKVDSEVINYTDEILKQLIKLAEDVELLLNQKFSNKSLEWFREQYINKLKVLGYANINGSVKQKKLLTDFVDYYGDKLLTIFQSNINTVSKHIWLTEMFRKKKKSNHPIRHLLLMDFLGISIKELFYHKIEYKPFGDGPWPCLNAASEHYRQLKINEMDIKYGSDSKSPIGIFKCSCGFQYKRTGPDVLENDKYRITKIIEFGPIWENKLNDLVSKGFSLREIAHRLKVDPVTVKKYSNKSEKDSIVIQVNNETNDCEKANYRLEWINLRRKYSNKSKTELRKENRSLFIWLYRNDKEWLNNNSPDLKFPSNNGRRVDWDARDDEIIENIKCLVESLYKSDDKPKKITVSSIGDRLGIKSLLEKHLDKLPKTNEYLKFVVENNDDFRIRRIKWAIRQLKQQENDIIKVWKIFRMAGIREEYKNGLIDEVKK
ncbi:MAG: hypothetical protein Q607_CBUC00021G0100 [Clostridium butyricum DORA_1]|jgi:hypothetical protein|nr:MAG: hypothetical protein Q607_CBUC00021G0100 [Clostridium butyricum DORA_1]MDU1507406.1 TnsD family transposase [Clostridium butyricum]MDU4800490.1 TnsD family transposase [Clostridium butyricum]